MFSVFQSSKFVEFSSGVEGLGFGGWEEFDDPGTMGELVAQVALRVVGRAILPHAPEDLGPPGGEAA